MELTKLLQDLGLEEKECKVYLALLQLGETTATKISEKTNLDRTLIYQLTNKLIEKGLVSYIIKNNVKYFSSANPKKLLQDLKEKELKLQEVMPELINLTKAKEEETRVEIFRGKEGLKAVLKDLIRTKKDYVAFGEEGRFQQVLPIDIHQFLNQIVKNNIHEKVLVREDLRGIVVSSKNSEFRYLPKEYLSPVTIAVYGNKVANFIWTSPYYAILTENKEIANSLRSQFNALWKLAKK
ncbi:MAG: helix-turn-helix domain-containing protein [Candidatus Nanoarchaeia archaeon]|nr:helix-turn-helix domain-containing protein [Candidatus Nanoarchaeia archaeon]MDD5741192.1 helix-turn-helix domain-containing protein [Candidatus Nanoarchaeia archaeon]